MPLEDCAQGRFSLSVLVLDRENRQTLQDGSCSLQRKHAQNHAPAEEQNSNQLAWQAKAIFPKHRTKPHPKALSPTLENAWILSLFEGWRGARLSSFATRGLGLLKRHYV